MNQSLVKSHLTPREATFLFPGTQDKEGGWALENGLQNPYLYHPVSVALFLGTLGWSPGWTQQGSRFPRKVVSLSFQVYSGAVVNESLAMFLLAQVGLSNRTGAYQASKGGPG